MEYNLRGVIIKIDEDDYDYVDSLNLTISRQPNGAVYIQHWKKGKCFYLHRLLLNAPKGRYVDHINHDPLDNRRCNIRLCSPSDNMRNTINRKNTTGYRGVYFDKRPRPRPYRAEIKVDKKRVHLGSYETAIEAAKVWDSEMFKHYPDTATLNFPNDIV